jgi:hypothetical protein
MPISIEQMFERIKRQSEPGRARARLRHRVGM